MWKNTVDWLIYSLLGLSKDSHLVQALHFFIYDTVKILFLLIIIIFIVALIRSFFPPERTRKILSHFPGFTGNIFAALLGVVTPFCSCSAVPLFLGFVEAGIPLGVTFSFLIASPMINEVAFILLLGMFGWKIALLYTISGLTIAIIAGLVIGKLKVENLLEDIAHSNKSKISGEISPTWIERLQYAKEYTWDILKTIWVFVFLGIGIGALIHGYVPTNFLAQFAGADKWYAVPLATLIGIPLYSNAAGVIPLVSVLTEKGVAMGTTLSFMMAVTALSLPEFLILRKIMKPKLILIFASVVGIGIMFTGYLFNFILK
ncbi:MAG: permease [Candidatus Margulisiibacteriota bacterium]|jgi:hypothetical protein